VSIDLSEFYEKPASRCVVIKKIKTLGEADQETFEAALAEKAITNQAIVRWALTRGIDLKNNAVRLHRVSECSCRG
jgi:hypothetical protein